jgi:Zn-dependent peptidase ImmA (M78 family)
MKKDISVIIAWESGESAPTYTQLEKLAYNLYKRPLAIFFFPQPPCEPDPVREFRLLPRATISNLSSDTRYAVRLGQSMQISLEELTGGANPAARQILHDIELRWNCSPLVLAKKARDYLGISLNDQISWKDASEALKRWRSLVQEKGIFVFKRSFKQRDISGFCLYDDKFPIIYLNNSMAITRQIFTLFHEMAHLLTGSSSIDRRSRSDTEQDAKAPELIESFINQFVAELLVPSEDFDHFGTEGPYDADYFRKVTERYHVSRDVILRKLFDGGLIDKRSYQEKLRSWSQDVKDKRSRTSGGNYYATQAAYLGDKYLQLAFEGYYRGHFGVGQLADYLNVKPRSVPGLEQIMLDSTSS